MQLTQAPRQIAIQMGISCIGVCTLLASLTRYNTKNKFRFEPPVNMALVGNLIPLNCVACTTKRIMVIKIHCLTMIFVYLNVYYG